MSPAQARRTAWDIAVGSLVWFAKVSGGLVLLASIFWPIAKPWVAQTLHDLSGTAELHAEIEQLRQEIARSNEDLAVARADMTGAISQIFAKLDEISPLRALKYDPYTSTAAPSCVIGEWCAYRIRVARTQAGMPCRLIDVSGTVVNHNGAEYPVEIRYQPARLGTTYQNIDGEFMVLPRSAQPGAANFYLVATYEDCLGQEIVREPSPVMRTHLEASK